MNNIKDLLDKRNISIRQMSKDLDLAYSVAHKIATRDSIETIALGRIAKIADYLEVPIQKLYEGDNQMLKNIIKELEELKGEEFTVLEMDNAIQNILGIDAGSILEGETEDYIEGGQFTYTTWIDEEQEDTVDINILFEVLEENEVSMDVLVKMVDIEEL